MTLTGLPTDILRSIGSYCPWQFRPVCKNFYSLITQYVFVKSRSHDSLILLPLMKHISRLKISCPLSLLTPILSLSSVTRLSCKIENSQTLADLNKMGVLTNLQILNLRERFPKLGDLNLPNLQHLKLCPKSPLQIPLPANFTQLKKLTLANATEEQVVKISSFTHLTEITLMLHEDLIWYDFEKIHTFASLNILAKPPNRGSISFLVSLNDDFLKIYKNLSIIIGDKKVKIITYFINNYQPLLTNRLIDLDFPYEAGNENHIFNFIQVMKLHNYELFLKLFLKTNFEALHRSFYWNSTLFIINNYSVLQSHVEHLLKNVHEVKLRFYILEMALYCCSDSYFEKLISIHFKHSFKVFLPFVDLEFILLLKKVTSSKIKLLISSGFDPLHFFKYIVTSGNVKLLEYLDLSQLSSDHLKAAMRNSNVFYFLSKLLTTVPPELDSNENNILHFLVSHPEYLKHFLTNKDCTELLLKRNLENESPLELAVRTNPASSKIILLYLNKNNFVHIQKKLKTS